MGARQSALLAQKQKMMLAESKAKAVAFNKRLEAVRARQLQEKKAHEEKKKAIRKAKAKARAEHKAKIKAIKAKRRVRLAEVLALQRDLEDINTKRKSLFTQMRDSMKAKKGQKYSAAFKAQLKSMFNAIKK